MDFSPYYISSETKSFDENELQSSLKSVSKQSFPATELIQQQGHGHD